MGLLDKVNKMMNTANHTVSNVDRTKHNLDRMNKSNQNAKQQKAAEKALEWKCDCGKKNTSKFCDGCGKAKPVCSQCGARATGSKFCPECGNEM